MTVTQTTASQAGAAAGAIAALPMAMVGLQADALGVGIFGALFISIWMPTVSTRRRAFAAVTLSGSAAGFFAPIAANAVAAQFHWLLATGDALRLPIALSLGVLGPTILPLVLRMVKARGESEVAK